MNVAILGVGKLGVCMAALYASVGHTVYAVDRDEARIEQLQAGTFRTDEPEVETLLAQHRDRLHFERLPHEAVLKADIAFVVVPTPSKADGTFDSQYVVTAVRQIGVALREKQAYTLVAVVSTLMPGQMDADVLPALEDASGKQIRAGANIGLCYSPEFIALGRVIEGLRKPDYILVGSSGVISALTLAGFYLGRIVADERTPVHSTSFVNAELAKLATNAYLSLKIAYANVLGQICETLPGANVDVVTQAVGADHRIGSAYLRAGLPAGGVCLPRDLKALAAMESGGLIEEVIGSDGLHAGSVLEWIYQQLPPSIHLGGKIAVLGTAYSETTHLTEESWGDWIAGELAKSPDYSVNRVKHTLYAQYAVDEADAVVLALPLDEYRALAFHAGQTVFDIWRVLDADAMPEGVTLWQLGVGAKAHVNAGGV